MKLKLSDIRENRALWLSKGYALPEFDIEAVRAKTETEPEWVHCGAGNIFRAFLAVDHQKLLNAGLSDTGIIAVAGFDYENLDKTYTPYDNLCLSVMLKADGTVGKTVVASVSETSAMIPGTHHWDRLKEIFSKPSLKMVSFTITEKNYNTHGPDGTVFPNIAADMEGGPEKTSSYMGKTAALCLARYNAGAFPVSLVSMDNCSHNGDRLKAAILEIAEKWVEKGFADKGFIDYLSDSEKVGFPWSMIDKITPKPDNRVIELLQKDGFEDATIITTSRGSVVAPFVNAEETQYLVIENWFPNGRIPLDHAGVIFTDRETVDKVEKMKVCTCLNPLHTSLAVYGCLLGYELISEEMKDPDLKKMVETIGYKEGLPVVVNPGIIDPKEFIDTVINVRFPNVFMPDAPQRIATDSSQKIPIRFGETIKAYKAKGMDINDLKIIPLVFAGWCRYTMGIDDEGNTFTPSPDPMLDMMQKALAGIKLGDKGPFSDVLRPIFSNETIFGVNLYEVGLGEKAEGYFEELIAGKGAVRKTLQKYLA